MYNDLQDALGYRTDQNAPFNPTYSIASQTCLETSHQPCRSGASRCIIGTRRSSAGLEDADPDLLVIESTTGAFTKYGLQRGLYRISRIPRDYWGRCQRTVPTICPASPCPATYPPVLPGRRWRAHRFLPVATTFLQEHPRRTRLWRTRGPGFRGGQQLQRVCRSIVNHRFSHGSLFAESTHGRRRWMTGFVECHHGGKCARTGVEPVQPACGLWPRYL